MRTKSSLGLFLGALLLLSACDQLPFGPEEAAEEPTEPWRADAPKEAEGVAEARLVTLSPQAGQFLDFEAKGKKARPRGRVLLTGGSLRLDPLALEHTQGELVFDLRQLIMVDESGSLLTEQSAAAQRWLGLGAQVPAEKKLRAARATFTIRLLKSLSVRSAHSGEVLRDEEGKPLARRRVRATVVGELSIAGLSVQHRVLCDFDFTFDGAPSRARAPRSVTIRLVRPDRVPLAEHEIAPRDAAGNRLSRESEGLGIQVGRSAKVSGEVRLDVAGN